MKIPVCLIGCLLVTIAPTIALSDVAPDKLNWKPTNITAVVRNYSLPAYTVQKSTTALRSTPKPTGSGSVPLSLASGDFDEDGATDLITGSGGANGGSIVLHRGNSDALFPNTVEARERRQRGSAEESSFFSGNQIGQIGSAPQIIVTGDVDADGHIDIVAGTYGETTLWWLGGDGKGGFSEPHDVSLVGPLTALAAGDVNRRDGLTDIVIATGGTSPRLSLFEGPQGAFASAVETLPLPGEARDIVLGTFDSDAAKDIAVLLPSEIVIVKGRDRQLTLDAERRSSVNTPEIARIPLTIDAIAMGPGDGNGTEGESLVILASDSAIYRFTPQSNELVSLVAAAESGVSPAQPSSGASPRTRLLRARASNRTGSDTLIVTNGSKTVGLLTSAVTEGDSTVSGALYALTIPENTVDLLPLRLNADSVSDLVVLTGSQATPHILATTTGPTYVINSNSCDPDYNGPKDIHGNPPPPDGICRTEAGECTLNAALSECRAHGGDCTFNFSVPGNGIPYVCWNLTMGTASGVYDGTNQSSGFARIDIFGGGELNFPDNVTLRGMYIPGGTMGSNAVLEGNRIGVTDDLSVASGGVISVGANSQVGGTTAAARNVISGLWITGDNVKVEGNHFGFNDTGTHAYSTGSQCIEVRTRNWGEIGPKNVTIGGLATGSRNLFAGRVEINPGTSGLLFQGNHLGVDITGMVTVFPSERGSGMTIAGTNHTIGGTATAARNIFAANGSTSPGSALTIGLGVRDMTNYGTSNILVQGNYIGTNNTGNAKLGSWGNGIIIQGLANTVLIGGTSPGAGNVISGSKYAGISIEEGRLSNGTYISPHDNVIQGNYIGTDKTGLVAIPNLRGVTIKNSWDNLIGGTESGARNLISGNSETGILVWTGYANSKRNTFQGNYIGVDITGLAKLANGDWGMYVDGADNVIGGLTTAARNVISGNGGSGIQVLGSNQTVQGNYIGVGVDGVTPIGNRRGIQVDGTGGTIGGTTASARNVISASTSGGIIIPGSGHTVQGNYVGVAANGTTPLGNLYGIRITGSNNQIGGEVVGAPNVIANGSEQGVIVAGGTGNAIRRNQIFNNSMGIDLGNNGVTANDPQDADTGPNLLQNAPTLTSIETATGFTVHGALHSAPSTTYRLEFFANCALDSSGQGEGQSYLGSQDVTTSSLGDVLFSTAFSPPACPIITANATDPGGNTSEFSLWLASSVTLTTSVSPSGSGAVTPDCSAGCSYPIGTTVVLTPAPAMGRTFSLWSGDVSSLNTPLTLTMNGSKHVVANFDATPSASGIRVAGISPVYYTSLQQAYTASHPNDVIQLQVTALGGTLNATTPGLSVTLKGGYNSTYSAITGHTIVGSPVVLREGTVTVDSITIK